MTPLDDVIGWACCDHTFPPQTQMGFRMETKCSNVSQGLADLRRAKPLPPQWDELNPQETVPTQGCGACGTQRRSRAQPLRPRAGRQPSEAHVLLTGQSVSQALTCWVSFRSPPRAWRALLPPNPPLSSSTLTRRGTTAHRPTHESSTQKAQRMTKEGQKGLGNSS